MGLEFISKVWLHPTPASNSTEGIGAPVPYCMLGRTHSVNNLSLENDCECMCTSVSLDESINFTPLGSSHGSF